MRARSLMAGILLGIVALLTGCDGGAASPFAAEIDEPNYRRGKDLLRQGRNQEALDAFQKVIEKRGDDAPESHLEVAILYQQHIKDPISAIYHYRKFRQIKPTSPQSDLVRQRIDAAMREFARTLPAQPLENQLVRSDLFDSLERLQRENALLKEQLAASRAGRPVPSGIPTLLPGQGGRVAQDVSDAPVSDAALEPEEGPIGRAVSDDGSLVRPSLQSAAPPTLQPPARPVPPGRKHVVGKGDTLFSLSQRYYGNRSRWREIYAANREVMASENDLKIGMELRIP
jgi:tetratricopeptide (TPR) repeat protein